LGYSASSGSGNADPAIQNLNIFPIDLFQEEIMPCRYGTNNLLTFPWVVHDRIW
jgi:hypothetical protein